jgi:repressor of nif and glnA expression
MKYERNEVAKMIMNILSESEDYMTVKEITYELWKQNVEDVEHQQVAFLIKTILKGKVFSRINSHSGERYYSTDPDIERG